MIFDLLVYEVLILSKLIKELTKILKEIDVLVGKFYLYVFCKYTYSLLSVAKMV